MAAEIQVLDLVLEMLKIAPDLLSKYSSAQDQILWLLFVPHVVLFLFLFSFGYWISPMHHGLRYLVTIAAYVVLIFTGWYGTFIVPVVNSFFIMFLAGAFIFFIFSKVLHPTMGGGFRGVVSTLGRKAGDVAFKDMKVKAVHAKEYNALAKELEAIDAATADLTSMLQTANVQEDREIYAEISKLKIRKHQIEAEMKRMK